MTNALAYTDTINKLPRFVNFYKVFIKIVLFRFLIIGKLR